jgi:hypothetical protein
MVELGVVHGDLTERPCDVLVLKHADEFYGVDQLIAERVGFKKHVPEGESALIAGQGIGARRVLFIGVGPLRDFRYPQIRRFGFSALQLSTRVRKPLNVICTCVHGSGYGLDEREAFLSLVGGFLDGLEQLKIPDELKRIEIVETNKSRADRLSRLLSGIDTEHGRIADAFSGEPTISIPLADASREELSLSERTAKTKPNYLWPCPLPRSTTMFGRLQSKSHARRLESYASG